ncbi:oxidoreductase [Pseudoduganella albidiflava]|uniref:Oxidoreductase n=1 Tax=Pseudoduganella albidiflava TaxID=321983 RepID=A0A411WWU5_9BURK|nr:oxidoreductase [Pseudoduganella albidiflava]QBI01225.1 oxidoreductase [Pseudoduganella albidiflava]GGY49154.1 scyllo-inositol 2-dehydrogenase (NADP(+)) [Pseudoduganella albidiflava]
MQRYDVGLVGYGLGGAIFHAPMIAAIPGLRLARIASRSADPATLHPYPGVRLDDTPQAMLDDPAIALVVVCTPNASHYALAKAALQAGKHVVVDKPFVLSSAEGDELAALARDRGLHLAVYQNRRWDGDFLTLRRTLESGELGAVHTYRAHFDRYAPQVKARWKEQAQPGAGVLWDLGSHLIDQALQLFGKPHAVTAHLSTQRDGAQVEDAFELVLDHGGTKAVLHAGALVRAPGPRYQVHGTLGSFVKAGIDPQEDALKAGQRPGDAGWGHDAPANFATITRADGSRHAVETLPGAYQAFYQGMYHAIAEGGEVPVKAEEAVDVIRVIEHALRSHRERRTIDVT